MKIVRIVGVLMLAMSLTGCDNVRKFLFPTDRDNNGDRVDASTICRATPGTWTKDVENSVGSGAHLGDDVRMLTGEVNGEDGVSMVATICKRDAQKNLVGCVDVSHDGILPDGTMFEFVPNYVNVFLAESNGWKHLTLVISYTCHGS